MSKGEEQLQQRQMEGVSEIPPQAKRRVLKDIERAQSKELQEQGIWYQMDESNMSRGKALIRGPPGTPYEGCLLLFSVQFPSDYPFSPPKVLFLTSDGQTRFHPNLYVQGKVCLSILGTYSGPSWSGTQSLSSVLLSILALLDANPLAHEPAYEKGTLADTRHREYALYVEYHMLSLMVSSLKQFEQKGNHPWSGFEEEIEDQLPSLKETLRKKILGKQQAGESSWPSVVYGMGGRSEWKKIRDATPWIRDGV